jgi:hypothetical protein
LATTDARVHCAVLKIRAVPATESPRAPNLLVSQGLSPGTVEPRPFGGKPVLAEGGASARSLRTQQRARLAYLPAWRPSRKRVY